MTNGNEAFSRVVIDAQLADQGWKTQDQNSVRYEYMLPDGTRADYVLVRPAWPGHGGYRGQALFDTSRGGSGAGKKLCPPAWACRISFWPTAKRFWFWEWESEAYPRPVKTFFKQADLERRFATRQVRQDPLAVEIDERIAGRDYQKDCIDTLCREMGQGRRKLLVEMATGTGKTRMAAALIKRLFKANAITRVLFLVDRIPLAKQTEDAFAEHLPDYPCYVLRAGPPVSGRKADHHHDAAKHDQHLRRVFLGVLRL